MKCFQFSNGEKKEGHNSRKSTSDQSNSTTSTDRDTRRSGSEFNSQNVSDMSNNSMGRSPFLSFSQRPNNLRIFTFSELKNATRNFSRALMIGEGGFGCVYRGMIRSSDDPSMKLEIAVKQLNRKGLQVKFRLHYLLGSV